MRNKIKQSCLVAFFALVVSSGFAQYSQSYFVRLSSGQQVTGRVVKYVNPPFKEAYLLVDEQIKYPIRKVKSFQNEKGFFLKGSLPPYGEESFVRRTLDGKVSLYERTTVTYLAGPNSYGAARHTTYDYYQTGYSGLKKLNQQNLRFDLSAHAPSLAQLDKARNVGTIQSVFYGLGAACMVYGLVSFANQDHTEIHGAPQIHPAMIAAPICLLIPLPLQSAKREHLKQAILLFNQAH